MLETHITVKLGDIEIKTICSGCMMGSDSSVSFEITTRYVIEGFIKTITEQHTFYPFPKVEDYITLVTKHNKAISDAYLFYMNVILNKTEENTIQDELKKEIDKNLSEELKKQIEGN